MNTNLHSKEIFEDRLNEIKMTLETVSELESNGLQIDFVCAVKSSIILMTYNLIESTVVNTMNEFYSRIFERSSYVKKNSPILDIWIDSLMITSYGRTKTFDDHNKTAHTIVDKYSRNDFKIQYKKNDSGNMDADKILTICRKHGIPFEIKSIIEPNTFDCIHEIKDIRNKLAHGEESFIEAGRNQSISDVYTKITQVERYLRFFLLSVDEHIKSIIKK